MHNLAVAAQLVVAVSVFYVWTVRFGHVIRDFEQFRYSSTFRNTVGVVKLALATLLIVGIWNPAFVLGAALGMSLLMLGAQWSHVGVGNPIAKRAHSAVLLALSLFVAVEASGVLA